MPIYEFQCLECDSMFEQFVFPGRTDDLVRNTPTCPECEGSQCQKIPSIIGLAMHNKEMVTPRDGYKVRNRVKEEVKKDD